MAKREPNKIFAGHRGVTIVIDFDTNRKPSRERQIQIRWRDGHLQARMFQGWFKNDPVPGHVRVWRPDGRSFRVAFGVDMLREGTEKYRWKVWWYHRNTSCPGSCQIDTAPDRGWYAHLL